jgi:autotransporter-associated beta strand protein
MNKKFLPKLLSQTAIAAIAGLAAVHSAQATLLYWDSNGATAGAGITPTGTWGTSDYWSTSSAGTVATPPYTTTAADDVNFSAGSDASGAYTVTLNGTQNALSVQARTGQVTLVGGTLALANVGSSASNMLYNSNATALTIGSTILVNNNTAGNNFLNFGNGSSGSGGTITINGPVTATTNNATNKIFIRQTYAGGTVVINSNLGSDAGFLTGLQASGTSAIDGAAGTLTLNGAQGLGTTGLSFSAKTGTVNLGDTVNTGNAVTLGAISIGSATANLAGATININSAVSSGAITIRNGGVLNVAGSVTTSSFTVLGRGSVESFGGGTIKVQNGGAATLTTVIVRDNTVFTNAGTLTGTALTLGEATLNTSGKFAVGDATGAGTTTFTSLATAGTGTGNAIVGGNSAISTFTLNNSAPASFSGVLGGAGANENNLALVKQGASSLTLSGANTYTGNTTVSAGTLILADNATLNFGIAATGVNNTIGGTGTLTLNGDFTFDLTGAAATGSWNIVNVGTLSAIFAPTFTVTGFTDAGSNTWTRVNLGSTYTFDEATGLLTAIPEPATWALLAFSLTTVVVLRRRR